MFYTGKSCTFQLQDGQVFCLEVAGSPTDLRFVPREGEAGKSPSSREGNQRVSWYAPKFKRKRPIEEHDDHAVDPLEDGRGVLEDETLLAEKNSTW